MSVVTFLMAGRPRAVDAGGGTLLEAAQAAGLPLASSCRGVGVCDSCRVIVVGTAAGLTERTALEAARGLGPDERMACQAGVVGAVTITTSYW